APVPTPVPPTGPARDTTPPRDVRNLVAKAGDRTVSLSWISPGDADFDHVSVVRSTATAGAAAREIYRGTRESVRDRGLKNNVRYRYLVVAYDAAGNRTAGVAASAAPRAVRLTAPA